MENNKEGAMEKWGAILGNTDQLEQESSLNVSMLPMTMKVAAQTIGFDLVSVVPMGSNTGEEMERIQAEVKAENRERKIDSITEDSDYEEMKVQEHPDFKAGPKGELFYLDFTYSVSTVTSSLI